MNYKQTLSNQNFYIILNNKYPKFYRECVDELKKTIPPMETHKTFICIICRKIGLEYTNNENLLKHIEENEEKVLIYEL